MNKKNMSEEEFLTYINAEIISYYTNMELIEKNLKYEYVDRIANTYSDVDLDSDNCVETFVKAKHILEKEYGVDMMSLPFKHPNLKDEIKEFEQQKDIKI